MSGVMRRSRRPPGDELRDGKGRRHQRTKGCPGALHLSLLPSPGAAQEPRVTTQAPVSPFDVVPAVTLEVQPDVLIEPLLRPRTLDVRVAVRNHAPGPTEAAVKLELPLGFALDPPVHAIHFAGADEERRVRFVVRPSRPLVATRFPVNALAVIGDQIADSALDAVDYPHISRKIRLRPARALLLALDVRTRPSARVAWVRGTGDVAAEAVAALGIPCDPLGPDDLAFADLSRYTTILVGVRAYEVRSDLRLAHGRLLDWVRSGVIAKKKRSGSAILHTFSMPPFNPFIIIKFGSKGNK